MIGIRPYLNFPGTCREAMLFYSEVLGGDLKDMLTYGSMPGFPPEAAERILHSELHLPDGAQIFACDAIPGSDPVVGNDVSISLSSADIDGAGRMFELLAEGGSVAMPFEKSNWGDHFGMLVDRYGFRWMVSANEEWTQYE